MYCITYVFKSNACVRHIVFKLPLKNTTIHESAYVITNNYGYACKHV